VGCEATDVLVVFSPDVPLASREVPVMVLSATVLSAISTTAGAVSAPGRLAVSGTSTID
jgi:hypothetical protein